MSIELHDDCEDVDAKFKALESENTRLKAEVEQDDVVIDELRAQTFRIAQEAVNYKADRDRWKNLCEALARSHQEIVKHQEISLKGSQSARFSAVWNISKKALALFDQAGGGK